MSTPLLLQALHRQPVSRPPVWLMRQAGRYLPEYRAIRANFPNFIQFCLTPDAATEVTLQPVLRFGLDAAIIFADILTIPHALGHNVTFTEGNGPHVEPLIHPGQLVNMRALLPEIPLRLAAVAQTVAQTRAALPADKAVIGFCGAPWTLACYMLDSKPSQGIPNTLAFAAGHPAAFAELLAILTEACTTYLGMQAAAGATAVQVFDSWALICPPHLWQTAIQQRLLALAGAVRGPYPQLPVMLFPRGVQPEQLQSLVTANTGTFQGLSLSTEHNLLWAHHTLQPHVTIQGNLDPALMTGPAAALQAAATRMLNTAAVKPGYIVNLGHGLTPQTDVHNVELLVDTVRAWQPPQL